MRFVRFAVLAVSIAGISWLMGTFLSLRQAADSLQDLRISPESFSVRVPISGEVPVPSGQRTTESATGTDGEYLIGLGDAVAEDRTSERRTREAEILASGLTICDPDAVGDNRHVIQEQVPESTRINPRTGRLETGPVYSELPDVYTVAVGAWPECHKTAAAVNAAIAD